MSEPIDHYAKAVGLAQIAEAKAVDSRHYAAVAHLHLDLHTAQDSDSGYWELARQLETLTAAAHELITALSEETTHDPATSTRVDDAREALWAVLKANES